MQLVILKLVTVEIGLVKNTFAQLEELEALKADWMDIIACLILRNTTNIHA